MKFISGWFLLSFFCMFFIILIHIVSGYANVNLFEKTKKCKNLYFNRSVFSLFNDILARSQVLILKPALVMGSTVYFFTYLVKKINEIQICAVYKYVSKFNVYKKCIILFYECCHLKQKMHQNSVHLFSLHG